MNDNVSQVKDKAMKINNKRSPGGRGGGGKQIGCRRNNKAHFPSKHSRVVKRGRRLGFHAQLVVLKTAHCNWKGSFSIRDGLTCSRAVEIAAISGRPSTQKPLQNIYLIWMQHVIINPKN